MSKGSRRRPIDPKVERKVFEDNWDRIFNKDKQDLAFESDNPLERPYNPRGLWEHNCKHEGQIFVELGASCNWCGLYEDGTLD